jgi:hypothetical protein
MDPTNVKPRRFREKLERQAIIADGHSVDENERFLALQRVEALNHPGLDHWLFFGSGRQPIFKSETGDALKVPGIMRHHS